MAIFDADIDVEKGDMGRGGVPGEVDGIPFEFKRPQLRLKVFDRIIKMTVI